jgi:lipoprotein-anchoring transpeptidase ErfK/SrfK
MRKAGWFAAQLLTASVLFAEQSGRSADSRIDSEGAPVRRVVVSLRDRKLALIERGRVIKIYRTAVGASRTPSPTGTFTIANRVSKPSHYRRRSVTPPGPNNPLGTRWLGLSLKSYGIHGTNSPSSIGRAASHGCIRLRNRDVEELFELVRVGDVVELHEKLSEPLAKLFAPDGQSVDLSDPSSNATVLSASNAAGQQTTSTLR